jgi:hypothetical protein
MSSEPRHLNEQQLAAALLAGAAPPRCAVPGCVSCAARLEEAKALAQEFHQRVLPRTLPQLRARGGPWWASWTRPWLMAPAGVLAAAAVLFLVWPRQPPIIDTSNHRPGPALTGPQPDVRHKGPLDAHDDAHIFVRSGEQVRRLGDDEVVHPADSIRFVVDPRRARHVLVVSIDGAQQISVYVPFAGLTSLPLPQGDAPIELEGSVVLDGTLGEERLWILLSDEPISVAAVRPALERLVAAGAAAVLAANPDQLVAELPGVRAQSWVLHKTTR